jgi:hypothetical protein
MELIHIEEKQLDECLVLLFRNYLLFQTREEFANAISYPALLSNNPISKLPYSHKLETLLRFQKDNQVEYAGYKTLYGLLQAYSDTSDFYHQHLRDKTFVTGEETAWKLAKAVYYDREPTGIKKLDAIINRIYDLDAEETKDTGKDLDITMLILMLLDVLPASRGRQQFSSPDFQTEWETLRRFCSRMCALVGDQENNMLLNGFSQRITDGSSSLNRIFFLQVITQILEYIKNVSRPTDMTGHLKQFDLEGIWRDFVKTALQGENVYYRFEKVGKSYNLKVIEDFPTEQKYYVLATAFYDFDDDTPVMMVQHPKAGFEHVVEKRGGEEYMVWYRCKMDDEGHPNNIWLEHFQGEKGFEMLLHHLVKVDLNKELQLLELWEKKRQVNKYEKYSCYYPSTYGIYAITKSHIFISAPDDDSTYYKVPKAIDHRLQAISVDDEGGVLYVGSEKEKWIGFETIDLFISPQQFEESGVIMVDRIG